MTRDVETVYLIHHSHTDIGYTHDQPVVWDLHRRFLDAALDLCEHDADRDDDGAFRWTVETTSVLEYWLARSSDRQIERFLVLARAGRIEVTAMLANITPLYNLSQLIESFAPVRRVRHDFGLPVRTAMNSDVNGENWPLVDALIDLGITGFSMAINTHYGGALADHPGAFHWEGPSGRSILAWNGWSYGLARQLGISRDLDFFAQTGWPAVREALAKNGYDLPVVMLQIFDPFGDNGSADPNLPAFVRDWNARGRLPRLRIALPSEWWNAVAAHADRLPRLRGDWTDFWNFGCASSAREQAINRASRAHLAAADSAYAALSALNPTAVADPVYRDLRRQAGHAINFWDEHTWGADCSISRPDDDDTATQWAHKAAYAYTGRSLSLLLARDGVAELAHQVSRGPDDRLLIFNPCPWPRTAAGPVSNPEKPRGRAEDPTATRHFQDRVAPRAGVILKPQVVPGFGYVVVGSDAFASDSGEESSDLVVENQRFRLTFDPRGPGLLGFFDRDLNRDLVAADEDMPFFCLVHESLGDRHALIVRDLMFERPTDLVPRRRGWKPEWQAHRLVTGEVIEHRVVRSALGVQVTRRIEGAGVSDLVQEIFLPAEAEHVEFSARWTMSLETHPEATYLAFPFALDRPRSWFDLGGVACRPELDQLPGACRDYFTVQNWIELANDDWGVTIATPDAPMVQLGGFHFAQNQARFELSRALFLGWVTNNYWSTNFRARQPGLVSARYVVRPHRGGFDESAAHRFGASVMAPFVFQHLGESAVTRPPLPAGTARLLALHDPPVVPVRIAPASAGDDIVVYLLNASDRPSEGRIGPAALSIRRAARCDILEEAISDLTLDHGGVRLMLQPRELIGLRLSLGRGPQ